MGNVHNPTECNVCDVITNNPGLSNIKLGELADVGESTVRRHKAGGETSLPDPFFTDIPLEIVTSRGRSILTENGWEKITYRPQDLALLNALKYEDIERYLDNRPATYPPSVPGPDRHTAVLGLADLQLGKTQTNGGTQETLDGVLGAVEVFVADCKANPPTDVLILEGGDILEGFDNVATQRATNDLDLTAQVRTARRLLVDVLGMVKDVAPKVKLLSVPSNHAMVRVPGTKDFASTPANDWGIELSHQVQDVVMGRPGWGHVQFVRPPGDYAEAVMVTTGSGVKLALVHGHQANSQAKLSDYWRGQAMGRRYGLDQADVLVHGHYHNFRIETIGDSRWLVGLPSPDPGSDWYTNKTGNASCAGLLAFDLVPDKLVPWRNLRIL